MTATLSPCRGTCNPETWGPGDKIVCIWYYAETCSNCGYVQWERELLEDGFAFRRVDGTETLSAIGMLKAQWREQTAIQRVMAGQAAGGRDADDAYIGFKEAKALTALEPYELSRICASGVVRSQGGRRGRRVHAGDLARYMKERNEP